MNLSYCNELVADNLDTFLDYFKIEYKKSGNCYSLVCPFHDDADNQNGFAIYHNKTYVVAYCRTNCDKSVKRDGTTLIKRLLSRTKDTSYRETEEFISRLLNKQLPEECVEDFDPEKSVFMSAFADKLEVQTVGTISREEIRSKLSIPAIYYINRGFSTKILNDYDVGVCETKGKKFYNRVVIPCYDDKGEKYIGCTTRSQYEKCNKCKYYHSASKLCPITGYDRYVSSKWIHDGIKSGVTLFNIWKATDAIRDTRKAIIVEGPGDCIKLASKGIWNSLAVFGNTLKDGQAQILDSLGVMDLIVLLDNDPAGQQGCKDIKEKYSRYYRLYFPQLKGKDAGEIQTDEETADIRKILGEINNE